MELFDKVDPARIEERGFQLTVFSLSVIAILVAAVCILMYPTVSSRPMIFTERTSKTFFFGFCALSVLLLGYLIDRQIVVRRLRREIRNSEEQYIKLHKRAGQDLLSTISGMNHFQDRLAMEFRRAANSSDTLSVMVVLITPTERLARRAEITSALGDAAKAISRRLRREDSLYHFPQGAFAIVMPGVNAKDEKVMADRLTEGLNDVAGAFARFTYDVKTFNYPQHAATAHELEDAVRSLLPEEITSDMSTAAAFENPFDDKNKLTEKQPDEITGSGDGRKAPR